MHVDAGLLPERRAPQRFWESGFWSAGNQTGLETLPPVFRASSCSGCRGPGLVTSSLDGGGLSLLSGLWDVPVNSPAALL